MKKHLILLVSFLVAYSLSNEQLRSQLNHTLVAPVQAQSIFNPPSPPAVREPGGKKGSCPDTSKSEVLTAIVPKEGAAVTSQPSPKFLFFVPDKPRSTLKGTFRIQFQGKNVQPPASVAIKGTPGILSYTLNTPLAKDKLYTWSFEVTCGPGMYESVKGRVVYRPLSADSKATLDQIGSDKKAIVKFYREKELSLDAIISASELASTDRQFWDSQLKELELPKLIGKPVL